MTILTAITCLLVLSNIVLQYDISKLSKKVDELSNRIG